MKKLLMILLVASMLIGGCGKPNRIEREYKVSLIKSGYTVVMLRQNYDFNNDIRQVWQDNQFRTHTTFWSIVCGLPLF